MKTVAMTRDFSYRVARHTVIQYVGGLTYHRVPEAAANAILDAKAGTIIKTNTRGKDDRPEQ
ncbi:hypothetical protein [uncultured Bradyrhizobium sp.]|uniref:hypothetical protein n=1 Tax=uncultured Bradyrhizobium sp. TaxID=199684 RepID=UPI0035CB0AF5